MLKVILNRLKPKAEELIAEEQAGFRAGRSTTEQIFNLRILYEKYLRHQQNLYHVFIDLKNLWQSMTCSLMGHHAEVQYQCKSSSHHWAVLWQGYKCSLDEWQHRRWFRTTIGIRQGCLLSPTLCNIFVERIMSDALEEHHGKVSIGCRNITNLWFSMTKML